MSRKGRKSPVRHAVRAHTREGKKVRTYQRGTGKKPQRSREVVGTRTIPPKTYRGYHYFHGTPYENFASIMNTGLRPSESRRIYLSKDFMSAGAFGDLQAHLIKSTSSKIVVFAFDIPEDVKIDQIRDSPDVTVLTDTSLKPVAYVILERDVPNREDWRQEEFTEVSQRGRRR